MKYWDPLWGEIEAEAVKARNNKLVKTFETYKKDPQSILRTRKKLRNFTIIGFVLSLMLILLLPDIAIELPWFFFLPAVIPLALLLNFNASLRAHAADLTNGFLAAKQGWLYEGGEDKERGHQLTQAFKVFSIGNPKSQIIEDQFWGNFKEAEKTTPFWWAVFRFTVGSGKTRKSFRQEVLALRLARSLEQKLYISPEKSGLFSRRDIQTEWHEFNKAFRIESLAEVEGGSAKSLEVLSPAVQRAVMELKNKYGDFCLQFHGDVVLIRIREPQEQKYFTNLEKGGEIDERDVERVETKIRDLLGLCHEILRFLD